MPKGKQRKLSRGAGQGAHSANGRRATESSAIFRDDRPKMLRTPGEDTSCVKRRRDCTRSNGLHEGVRLSTMRELLCKNQDRAARSKSKKEIRKGMIG